MTAGIAQLSIQVRRATGRVHPWRVLHAASPSAGLSRSLRVAEQFVRARAGAVVVHTAERRTGALERGAEPDNVFLLPQGDHRLAEDEIARRYDEAYHHACARRDNRARGAMAMSLAPLLT